MLCYIHYNASSPVRVIPVNRMGVRRCDTVLCFRQISLLYLIVYNIPTVECTTTIAQYMGVSPNNTIYRDSVRTLERRAGFCRQT